MREKWYLWERVAADYMEIVWYTIVVSNYTIRWWEIDLICSKNDHIVFVEVKVVDGSNDLTSYLSPKKLQTLVKTMKQYMVSFPDASYQLDLIFVRDGAIYSHIPNITYDV